MKTSLFAIILSVLLVVIACQIHPAKADPIDIIDIDLEWFGPVEDVNHDGDVDYLDASLIVHHYGESGDPGGPGDVRWDINSDSIVNYLDASLFVTEYGMHWLVP